MTEIACPGPSGEVESVVVALIGAEAVRFGIDASQLTVDAGGRGLVLQGS